MYQVLYRKFRPRTFSDVVGQKTVTAALRNEIKNGRLAHAYLFTGCRGTGKTTCAKILAKAANCLHPVDGDPCNECEICRGIDDGSILDVTEIDAASNNGVDSIRDLREEVNYTPAAGTYRVYIIDEVHMLSAGAFNALLKTLEEPPAHVIFVLATTEVHKLPATILSRCQRFDFGRIAVGDMAARMQQVAQSEGFTLTDDAAAMLARLADGALRDALSLLDQCLSMGDTITAEVVEAATGMAGNAQLFRLMDAVTANNSAASLAVVDELYRGGKDMERLCSEWITLYRNVMIFQTVKDPAALVMATAEEWTQLKGFAQTLSPAAVLHSLSVLQQTLDRLRSGVSRRVEMEIAVLRLCDPALDSSNEALLRRIDALERNGVKVQHTTPAPQTAKAEQTPAVPAKPVEEAAEQSPLPEPIAPSEPPVAATPATPIGEEVPFTRWGEVLDKLQVACAPLHGVLLGSTAVIRDDIVLISTGNEMFRTLVTRDGNKKVLSECIYEVLGQKMRIGIKKAQVQEEETPADPLTAFLRQNRDRGLQVTNE